MKKIVLHVLAMSTYSGAENVVCQIIEMFSSDENMEMIYCSPDGPIRKILEDRNIHFEALKKLSCAELKRVIKKVKPTYIHAHDVRASMIASMCCGKIKLISHMHNNWEKLRKITFKSILYLFPAIKASTIIWVSESAYEQYFFNKLFSEKSIVLKNIIDVKKLRQKVVAPQEDKKYDIVYVGRLTYQKNPQRLISVLEQIISTDKSITAAVIGSGDLASEICHLVDIKKLQSNIDLLGYSNNPLPKVKNAKVFLMTSRWEGTPMCVLEALAIGTPVVSTPVDGVKDLIVNGENGFLSNDDIILAKKTVEIIKNDSLRREMSEKAKTRSEIYNSITSYKNKLMEIYD